jgi:hypothetical protein
MTTNRETGDLAGFFHAQGISPGKVKYYTGCRDQFFKFYQGGSQRDFHEPAETDLRRRRESGGISEMTGTGRHLKHLEIF